MIINHHTNLYNEFCWFFIIISSFLLLPRVISYKPTGSPYFNFISLSYLLLEADTIVAALGYYIE